MRQHSNRQIIVAFEPFFSTTYKKRLPANAKLSLKTKTVIYRALRDVVVKAGGTCLFQPEVTGVDTSFTELIYSIGSKRLGDLGLSHEATDVSHMNGTYGTCPKFCSWYISRICYCAGSTLFRYLVLREPCIVKKRLHKGKLYFQRLIHNQTKRNCP